MRALSLLAMSFACMLSQGQSAELQVVATGAVNPTDIDNMGDARMFVTEKQGRIRILQPDGTFLDPPFLDITAAVNATSSEQGLLGMTFDPDHAANGYFYVNYVHGTGNGVTRISRFTVSSTDPNVADPTSEVVIWTVAQPATNHNGGDLSFGPDGMLWFALGDGGGSGDPDNNAQNMTVPYGKMLRIDVHGTAPYSIPMDNPYAGSDPSVTLPEIWASGLRNPFRFSFDEVTGDLYIADVGQDMYEEIDHVPAGSPGGLNFGWRCYEGMTPFNTAGCGPFSAYEAPVHVHSHNDGSCSIIGGYVYRGSSIPALYGRYIYTDFCHGRFYALSRDAQGVWTSEQITESNGFGFAAMGVDQNGELYAVKTNNGTIYKITGDNGSGGIEVDVKLFLEGPFDAGSGSMKDDLRAAGLLPLVEPYTSLGMSGGGGETTSAAVLAVTGNNAVVDWVRIELRDAASPGQLVAVRHALLQRDGDVVMPDGASIPIFDVEPGEYHVVARHRNHLDVMTAAPVSLGAGPYVLDLRDPSTPVNGSEVRKSIGNTLALWAGDVNSDGLLKYAGSGNDRDLVLQAIGGVIPTAEAQGYSRADVNMDGVIRYTGASNDRDPILQNIGGVIPTNTRSQQIP